MPNATADGVHLKFQRAQEHVTELQRRVREFLDSGPFAVYEEEEPATGDLVTRVRVLCQPPVDLSAVIGDIVHSARTALDHLAWQLVLSSGSQPTDRTQFPIARSRDAFPSYAKACLKGVSKEAFRAIEQLKPYQGGDDRFWLLHRLDIEDKHHLLVPVGAAHRNILLEWSFLGNEHIPPMKAPPYALNPLDHQYPLHDGAEVFRVKRGARESESDQEQFRIEHRFTFEVAFGDGVLIAGEPVMPTLPTLVEEIRQAVEPVLRML
jgi:hypothetical protein